MRRRSPGHLLDHRRQAVERAHADRRPPARRAARAVLGVAGADEVSDALLVRDLDGLDRASGRLGDQGGDLVLRVELRAGHVVDHVLVAVLHERADGDRSAVGARDVRRPPIAGVVPVAARPDRGDAERHAQLGIEAHAEDRVGDSAFAHQVVGSGVLLNHERGIRRRRVQARCVDNSFHSLHDRSVDRRAVLLETPSDVHRADQEDAVGARERRPERLRLIEVAEAHIDPALSEVRELLRRARDEHDVGGRQLLEHETGGETAQLAGGAGDQDAHRSTGWEPVIVTPGRIAERSVGEPNAADGRWLGEPARLASRGLG